MDCFYSSAKATCYVGNPTGLYSNLALKEVYMKHRHPGIILKSKCTEKLSFLVSPFILMSQNFSLLSKDSQAAIKCKGGSSNTS